MGKKLVLITLAVFAFGFGSNAGTEMVEPYRAPASTYNYAPPPPRPVVYGPRISIGFGPAWGFYGPRWGVFRGPRFFRPHGRWHGHPRHWH